MNSHRRTLWTAALVLSVFFTSGLAACKDNDNAYRQALAGRDKQIKELQLALVQQSNQLKHLRSVLQMKQKEVGLYKDTPVTSSRLYKECRRDADRLRARLQAAERERDEYKLRYQNLKKKYGE